MTLKDAHKSSESFIHSDVSFTTKFGLSIQFHPKL